MNLLRDTLTLQESVFESKNLNSYIAETIKNWIVVSVSQFHFHKNAVNCYIYLIIYYFNCYVAGLNY